MILTGEVYRLARNVKQN